MIETWAEAHSPHEQLSEEDADEIWDWMKTQPLSPLTISQARANARRLAA